MSVVYDRRLSPTVRARALLASAVLCASAAAMSACHGASGDAREPVAPPPAMPSATPPSATPSAPLVAGVAIVPGVAAPADASAPLAPGSVRTTLFDDIGNDLPSGPQRDVDAPFSLRRRMPAGILGTKATDASLRATLASFCSEQERAFLQQARAVHAPPSDGPTSTVGNTCHCAATLATARSVSVACSDRADLGDAPAMHAYRGFSFAIEGTRARPIDFTDVCAPALDCARRFASFYAASSLATDTSDDLGHAPSAAALDAYFAHPVFVLVPGGLRVEIDAKLAGRASEGFALEVTAAALGPLYVAAAR